MRWTRRTTVVTASSAVVAAAGLATGLLLVSGQPPAPAPAAPATQPARPVHKADGPLRSPLTGERVKKLRTVLAVKIDNIVLARPQTGLTQADLVYVLPVEGGLSRFMAVFSSHLPRVIGPVRSAREDDLQLLRQYGRPAFAYSGAQPQLLKVVERARVAGLYAGLVGGYFRDNSRIAPYNLYARTKRLLAEAKGASKAHDIGLRFGHAPAGGRARASASVSYSAASFRFTWSRARDRWLVWMDGKRAASTEGSQLSAATVVIQRTIVSTSRFLEWPGIRPPFARSIGSGSALVLRDGYAYHARWSRPHGRDGTTFTADSGQPMTFARGPLWIVLAPR